MGSSGDSFREGFGRGVGAALSALSGRTTRAGTARSPGGPSARRRGKAEPGGGSILAGKGGSGLLAGALAGLALSLARRWPRRSRPSSLALARGAVAGAGAAGAVLILRLLAERRTPPEAPGSAGPDAEPEEAAEETPGEVVDELLGGAGRGLIYAALLDPYLPGPPVLRGALVGAADYLAAPLGGLFSRLQEHSPVGRVPLVSLLLDPGEAREDPFGLHLLEGALLGLIYGDGPD